MPRPSDTRGAIRGWAILALPWMALLALPGCSTPPPDGDGGVDGGAPVDGSALDDAEPSDGGDLDASGADAALDGAGSPVDGGDAGATCDCPPPDPATCLVAACMDENCVTMTAPDDTACGPARRCVAGVCTHMPACGDGHREGPPSPPREGCDDGNLVLGDACDASCVPSVLLVASRGTLDEDAPAGAAPAVAVDDAGNALFVWTAINRATPEPTREVQAARFTAAGVRVGGDTEPPLVLESGIPLGEPLTPSVAGLASGWVVVWRSTSVEGADADLGGIAHRLVGVDGRLGIMRAANSSTFLDQREPRVARVGDGYVVAWTDTQPRAEDPGFGLRARLFTAFGGARTPEQVAPTTTTGIQSSPALASDGTRWTLAWADASAGDGLTRIRMRRYSDMAALDATDLLVSTRHGTEPSLAKTATSTTIAFTDRSAELLGTIAVVEVADAITPDADATPTLFQAETDPTAPPALDDAPSIAAHALGGYALAWQTDTTPAGARLALGGGAASVPESALLGPELVSGRQSRIAIAATPRGLWVTWSDDGVSAARRAFAAYLLPWD